MELYPESTWNMKIEELQRLAHEEGEDKLLELLILTEAYADNPHKMTVTLVDQLDEAGVLCVMQLIVEYLGKTAPFSAQI